MYKNVLFPILKALSIGDNEQAHTLALRAIQVIQVVPGFVHLIALLCEANTDLRHTMVAGIVFPNRIGLAAGLDKQAQMLPFFQALGFGHIEVGTVLPKYQYGNPRVRLARIPTIQALWNCMGFNSDGVEAVAERLKEVRSRIHIPIGGSVGKQKDTPLDEAAKDYVAVQRVIAPYVDYLVGNVSSPNTKDLRFLQGPEYLYKLVNAMVTEERIRALSLGGRPKPVLVKVAPDLTDDELAVTVEAVENAHADGIIAGNTTVKPPLGFWPLDFMVDENKRPKGGYSGPHQFERTLEMVKFIHKWAPQLAIVACGGISNGEDVSRLLDEGADLIQIYTSFIYQGPKVVRQLRSARGS